MTGNQSISITFETTPRSLNGKSYSSAIDELGAFVRKWGAKEMDFEVGSGLNTTTGANTTTEGVFYIKLGRESISVGTGFSTLLPLSTFSIPITKSSSAVSAHQSTASLKSSGLLFENGSMPSVHSIHGVGSSGLPILQSSDRVVASSNRTTPQPRHDSTIPPTTTPRSQTLNSSIHSGAATATGTDSYRNTAIFGSGSSAIPLLNLTSHPPRPSTLMSNSVTKSDQVPTLHSGTGTGLSSAKLSGASVGCYGGSCLLSTNSSRPVAVAPSKSGLSSSLRSSTGITIGSLTTKAFSAGCSAGVCPPSSNSSQPLAATLANTSLPITLQRSTAITVGSLTTKALSKGCSVGICPPSSNSSQPAAGTLTLTSIPAWNTDKPLPIQVNNATTHGPSAILTTGGLIPGAIVLSSSSINVANSTILLSPSIIPTSPSSIIGVSIAGSIKSSPLPISTLSTSITATPTSQSTSAVGLEPVGIGGKFDLIFPILHLDASH